MGATNVPHIGEYDVDRVTVKANSKEHVDCVTAGINISVSTASQHHE
jgi:hypothetical protein